MSSGPAVIIAAHDQPVHLRRLVDALAPLPTFVHIDAGVDAATHAALTDGLPPSVRMLPRTATPWAGFGLVRAELDGYRAVLAETDAEHVIFLSGADYPLVDVERIEMFLAEHPDRSFGEMERLPIHRWGLLRGYDRFGLWQFPWRRRRVPLPVPLRKPAGLRYAGGSVWKVLCRRHAAYVVRAFDTHPMLSAYFRRCWAPDEIAIPSLLFSPDLGGEDGEDWLGPSPWWVNWRGDRPRNPHVISEWAELVSASSAEHVLFARKFTDESGALLDRVDTHLRLATR